MSDETAAGPGNDTGTANVLYLLHLLAPFTAWLLAVVAVIVGMATRERVRGTWLDSHYSWLARTFWWGLLWVFICGLLTAVLVVSLVGIIVWWLPWGILLVWYLYRVIRGWILLSDRRPAPTG
ncbi:MAG TPA: hypothetical protein VEG27_01385 [Usitatibacter sp.]|nr:hypothetical protein [Usitatibacter sp.]